MKKNYFNVLAVFAVALILVLAGCAQAADEEPSVAIEVGVADIPAPVSSIAPSAQPITSADNLTDVFARIANDSFILEMGKLFSADAEKDYASRAASPMTAEEVSADLQSKIETFTTDLTSGNATLSADYNLSGDAFFGEPVDGFTVDACTLKINATVKMPTTSEMSAPASISASGNISTSFCATAEPEKCLKALNIDGTSKITYMRVAGDMSCSADMDADNENMELSIDVDGKVSVAVVYSDDDWASKIIITGELDTIKFAFSDIMTGMMGEDVDHTDADEELVMPDISGTITVTAYDMDNVQQFEIVYEGSEIEELYTMFDL